MKILATSQMNKIQIVVAVVVKLITNLMSCYCRRYVAFPSGARTVEERSDADKTQHSRYRMYVCCITKNFGGKSGCYSY